MADEPADRYPDSEGPFAGPNNTFPIGDKAHVENAWARIHQGPTEANHSTAEIADIKAKIQARAKELGITLGEHQAARSLGDEGTIERRAVIMPVELRALEGAEGSRTIGGYAAVFNRDSRLIPRMAGSDFVERVAPIFFEEARAAGWPGNQGSGVLCRWNHNDQYLLGTTQAGTTKLSVDRTGLEYRTDVPNCRDDVLEYIARGDCNRSSFTFMDAEDEWSYSGGVTHRTLISGGVLDVAPVSAVAAYQDTSVGLRSLAAYKDVPADDVFALAQQHELRKLFIRTDQAVPAPPSAEQLTLDVGETEERNVVSGGLVDIENLPSIAAINTNSAPPEPPAEPAAPPPLESEPPATLSWQEAHLQLLSRRPYDPIIKVTPKGNITS